MNYSNMVQRYYRKALKDVGIPQIRFHDLRHTYAQWTLLPGRSVSVEHGGTDEHVGISVKEGAHEELGKFGAGFETLRKAASVDDFHGGHLGGEILGRDVENALAQDGAGGTPRTA